jgi:hypothetical protein
MIIGAAPRDDAVQPTGAGFVFDFFACGFPHLNLPHSAQRRRLHYNAHTNPIYRDNTMHHSGRSFGLASILILTALSLGGCGAYVNIPAQKGDVATNDINAPAIRVVMIAACKAALTDIGLSGPAQIVLPAGATVLTYETIVPKISETAHFSKDGVLGEDPVLKLEQVRTRATDAEVDFIRPVGGDLKQLVTVYLKWAPMSGWGVSHIRVWRAMAPEPNEFDAPVSP